jgi:hypothetical protein
MADTIEGLKKELDHYKRLLGIGDDAIESYQVLIGICRQQREYLQVFNIKSKIGSDDKAAAVEYKNAKDLWENLPDMISKLNRLRSELKIEYDETEGKPKLGMTSPQNIGKAQNY